MEAHLRVSRLTRAADLLERQHPQLVPASERLPGPEPEQPTDQEIQEWADAFPEAPLEELDPEVHGWRRCFTAEEFGNTIRAALIRWGA